MDAHRDKPHRPAGSLAGLSDEQRAALDRIAEVMRSRPERTQQLLDHISELEMWDDLLRDTDKLIEDVLKELNDGDA